MRSWLLMIWLGCFGLVGSAATTAQQAPFRLSAAQWASLLEQLETHADKFKDSFKQALARSVLRQSEPGEYLARFQTQFEQATDRLRARSRDREPVRAEVQEVLNRAAYLATAMHSYDFGAEAEADWLRLSADLNQLARAFPLTTRWDAPVVLGVPLTAELEALANSLTGTYELDESRSDDPRAAIEALTDTLPANERRRVLTTLLPRLRAPQRLALERRDNHFTLASSLQTARTYLVDAHAFTTAAVPRGETPVALQYGDQFRLETQGPLEGLYTVAYDVTEQGARLHVSRTALLPQFARPIVVISRYKKIADAQRWNLSEEPARKPAGRQP